MKFVLVADECYPYIAICKCLNCGQQFLAEYTDNGIRLFGNICECKDGFVPIKNYPFYPEWLKIRKEWLEKRGIEKNENLK
jgi:hypothetical protein